MRLQLSPAAMCACPNPRCGGEHVWSLVQLLPTQKQESDAGSTLPPFSRSVSPITPPPTDAQPSAHTPVHAVINYDLAVDLLPPRDGRRFKDGRRFREHPPMPKTPKGTKGWTWASINEAITASGLRVHGSWRRGTPEYLHVFEGTFEEGHFMVNFTHTTTTVWVQGDGLTAQQVHLMINAARQGGARDA